jgi:hypothetical protein
VGRTGAEAGADKATEELETAEGELAEATTGLAGSEAKTAAEQSNEARTTKKYRKTFIPERHTTLPD